MNSKYSQFGSSDNNSDNNSGSSDNELDDLALKLTPYATVRGSLDSVFGTDTRYGQTIGVKFTDGYLVDGVAMARLDDNEQRDGTLKVFSWDKMPIRGSDYTADDAPEFHTETIVGNDYSYELVGARVEDAEDPGEPVPIPNDMVMWEGGNKKPSSTAKMFAQIFTEAGKDSIVDRDDINNWLNVRNIDARPDLLGRELDVFKVVKKGDEHDFHSPIVVDVKTEEQVLVSSREEPGSPSATDESDSSENGGDGDSSTVDGGEMEQPVVDFVEFCTDFGLSDEEQILDNLYDMAGDSGNDLTEEMVEAAGEDRILQEIVG